jgi:hypothetical protein
VQDAAVLELPRIRTSQVLAGTFAVCGRGWPPLSLIAALGLVPGVVSLSLA